MMKSVGAVIDPKNRRHCLEFCGIDIMVDETCKPWLIEANTAPCMEEESAYFA
jgi:D-alanine-D-alanine ligase-like ATP-grasp enzyme